MPKRGKTNCTRYQPRTDMLSQNSRNGICHIVWSIRFVTMTIDTWSRWWILRRVSKRTCNLKIASLQVTENDFSRPRTCISLSQADTKAKKLFNVGCRSYKEPLTLSCRKLFSLNATKPRTTPVTENDFSGSRASWHLADTRDTR